jgi:hypothetical protein
MSLVLAAFVVSIAAVTGTVSGECLVTAALALDWSFLPLRHRHHPH